MNGKKRMKRIDREPSERHADAIAGVRAEDGFALLVALVAIVGLTALATGGFLLANSERQVSESHQLAQSAFYTAEMGLNTYIGDYSGGTPASTVEYDFDSGATARVTATPMVSPTPGHRLHHIRSAGAVESPRGGEARRTTGTVVMTYSSFQPFSSPGAVGAPQGLHVNGAPSVQISGNDECGVEDAAGVAVGSDGEGYSETGGGPPGGRGGKGGGDPVAAEGDPPVDDSQTVQEMLDEWGMDWEGILDGDVVTPDHTQCGAGASASCEPSDDSWPDFGSLDEDEYPIVYADTDNHEVGGGMDGQGVLIVRGDLTFNGSFEWDGLILVGGSTRGNGLQRLYGSMLTGLNMSLPPDHPHYDAEPEAVNVGNGAKVYQYNSCHYDRAMESMQNASMRMARVPRSWHETF